MPATSTPTSNSSTRTSSAGAPLPRAYRFGPFELEVRSGELRKHGIRLRLRQQSVELLLLLLENHGEVVLREEICRRLWPDDIAVEFDPGINTAVRRLRDTLGDAAEQPRFIETLPGRGYRFIAAIEVIERQPAATIRVPMADGVLHMGTSLPRLRPPSQDLLNNIAIVRRLQETGAEESLYEDWKRLVLWLKSELRGLSPALRNWATPWVEIDAEYAQVNIEPDASWTFSGQTAVCLYFAVFPESSSDDDWPPNVGLHINGDWEHCDALRAAVQAHGRLPGFVSTYSSDGTTDPDCPFWKPLPLQDFVNGGTFDLECFVKEIGAAFEALAAVRPVIDTYLAEHQNTSSLVPPLRKALILALETWGPGKPEEDELVEVGLILTAYDPRSGELAGVLDRYEGMRDPGRRATATPSGRLTRRMVAGKRLINERVQALIAQSDVIISHNAFGFDKACFERLFPSSKSRCWLCSCRGLPWPGSGSYAASLPELCECHGIKNRDPHRAMPNAEALLHLLAKKNGAISYFARLIGSASSAKVGARAAAAARTS